MLIQRRTIRLAPNTLLLPFIWLNTLFANQTWSPTLSFIGYLFHWLSLLVAAYVVFRAFGRWGWPYVLVLLIVGSRLASLAGLPALYAVYLVSMLLLFVLAGMATALNVPHLVCLQLRTLLFVSLPVMFLQVAGAAEWLQMFNTLYNIAGPDGGIVRPEIRLLPLLFTSEAKLLATRYEDFYQFLSMQSRPPGLTHSSAMLAVFILAAAALHLGRMKGTRITLRDLTFACVIAMAGAKLALVGFVLLVVVAYTLRERPMQGRLVRMIGILGAVLLVYVAIFPAPAIHNFGPDAFEVSFLIRAVDATVAVMPDSASLPEVAEVLTRYSVVFPEDSTNFGGLSGLVTLITILPFVLAIVLCMLPWLIRGFRYCRLASPARAHTSALMAVVVLIVPFATPLFDSQFYALCLGIAMMPLAIGLSVNLRKRLFYAVHQARRGAQPVIVGQAHALNPFDS